MKFLKCFLAAVALIFLSSSSNFVLSQETKQVTLTREIVDALLQILTPHCRSELEAAIETSPSNTPKDITDECKLEIQTTLQRMGGEAREALEGNGQYEGEDGGSEYADFGDPYGEDEGAQQQQQRSRRGRGQSSRTAEPEPVKHLIPPAVGIALFVLACAGAVFFAAVRVNAQLQNVEKKPQKKLSKKKEEKLRVKQQQAGKVN